MGTNHSQQFSARYIHTNRLFNIFGKHRLMLVAGLLLLPQLSAASGTQRSGPRVTISEGKTWRSCQTRSGFRRVTSSHGP